jgi:predicted nucleic acid-binding protein
MAATVIVDASFLVALLDRRDKHHAWAAEKGTQYHPHWQTCESVISETFFALVREGAFALTELLRRRALLTSFQFADEQDSVLTLMQKYTDVPMSLADACLVRMTEIFPEPIVLTTDSDFRIYRRHSRQVVPCVMPP